MPDPTFSAQLLSHFRTTKRDLWQYRAADDYAGDADAGVRMLRDAVVEQGAAPVIPLVQKAIASTFRVLMRADDSNGSIQWVVRQLLGLHLDLCREAPPPAAKLVDWMMAFQFGEPGDYFELDISDYAGVLGETGLQRYRLDLRAREKALTLPYAPLPVPYSHDEEWHARRTLLHNAQRFAVLERDDEAIVATHGGDQPHAYYRDDAAKALVEAHFIERAMIVAREGMDASSGGDFQRRACGELWRGLVIEHDPDHAVDAAELVFGRWPDSGSASQLRTTLGGSWPDHRERVIDLLRPRPHQLVPFLLGEGDAQRAWDEAHASVNREFGGLGIQQWDDLITAYRSVDPLATLPVMAEQIHALLEVADTRRYPQAVRRMKALRTDAAAAGRPDIGVGFVAEFRERYGRRPSLIQRMDRAGLH